MPNNFTWKEVNEDLVIISSRTWCLLLIFSYMSIKIFKYKGKRERGRECYTYKITENKENMKKCLG